MRGGEFEARFKSATTLMHQSIPPAPSTPPPPPRPGWQIPGGGDSGAVKSPGVGTRGQMPHPSSKLQHFLLIAQSSSAILSSLMCDFLFQLTSSFQIVLF